MTSDTTGGVGTDEPVPEEEQQELIEEIERKRSLSGVATLVVSAIAIAFSVFQLYLAARSSRVALPVPFTGEEIHLISLQSLQTHSIHVAFALVLTFLLFPTSTGEGFLARRLGRIPPFVRERAGADHPVTGAVERITDAVRWLALDADRDRITPVDVLMIVATALAPVYMITRFEEIRTMRVFGLQRGETIAEIAPLLEAPVALLSALGLPLESRSAAFLLGALGILLVLEATRRALGFYLMTIVGTFVVYARWGYLIPGDGRIGFAVNLGLFRVVIPDVKLPFIGVFSIKELGWEQIVRNLWYTTEGIFGVPVRVSVAFIFVFILFGAFLEMSGAGQWFIELAYGLTGRRKGGPAKASIIASGFMGTISGSSIANTVTTGAFTIPLMKRTGYDPEFSGAVEASASSGGQILPPVMGAAAFLIVEFTGIPYAEVIIAATIPAIVFFFGVWVMVHLKASQEGISGVGDEEIVEVRDHLKRGWFYLLPIGVLLYYILIDRLTIDRAAWFSLVAITALIAFAAAYSKRERGPLLGGIAALFALTFASYAVAGTDPLGALATVATGAASGGLPATEALGAALQQLSWITLFVSLAMLLARPHGDSPLLELDPAVDNASERAAGALSRERLADNRAFRVGAFVVKAMDAGARTATAVVVAVAAAGVIPGVIGVSGLGPNLTQVILEASGGSTVLLLLLTAVSSIILGMGMPTTVTYIILVSMLGGAISQAGLPILAAHLFILYFGVIADITPPVAVAAYAASGVAKSDQFETGVKAFTLSLNKAIVPFAFMFAPGILLLRVTGSGGEASVVGWADVADLGFFVPEVVIPVIAMFLGVVALGPTVIGYYYTTVSRSTRALLAAASLLLMAPLALFDAAQGILGLMNLRIAADPLLVDLSLRAVGFAVFAALTVRNRRAMDEERAEEAAAPAA
ncbi:TRAP transporter permease [Halostella sp. JP-L12]|uniref:TRAP transporter permease n=1 Tax=Halostella TaxID=1843185 RepID=UPI000EF764E0|nr:MULTISPECIES: TRAP transporter fused permease subunit [Halostella]NHN46333.1 TRAP transporter permease [Halostella sp. JP-L12]